MSKNLDFVDEWIQGLVDCWDHHGRGTIMKIKEVQTAKNIVWLDDQGIKKTPSTFNNERMEDLEITFHKELMSFELKDKRNRQFVTLNNVERFSVEDDIDESFSNESLERVSEEAQQDKNSIPKNTEVSQAKRSVGRPRKIQGVERNKKKR